MILMRNINIILIFQSLFYYWIIHSISIEKYNSALSLSNLQPVDIDVPNTLPTACNSLPNGDHLLRFIEGNNLEDNKEYPNILATCSDSWTILNYQKDNDISRYFSSFQHWTDYVAGADLTHHMTWKQWFLPYTDGMQFRLSSDCKTCAQGETYGDFAAYFMTGDYIGCTWETKGYCDMDPTTLECFQCAGPDLQGATISGTCSHVELSADYVVTDNHQTCTEDYNNVVPSIGTNGQYCVCFKPTTSMKVSASLSSSSDPKEISIPVANDIDNIEIANIDSKTNIYLIYASDFESGTYRILNPGFYKLMEDVEFDFNPGNYDSPNAAYAWLPSLDSEDEYPGANNGFVGPYSLGFFAGVSIESSNVMLDLGGHELKMSKQMYLQQRWFSVIEIGNKPFISGQGPSNFGASFKSSSNIVIKNGKLGLTSHHGIHGNSMKKLTLRELEIYDFEVGGIQLNGFEDASITNVVVGPSATEVPVWGPYLQSRHILQRLRAGIEENPNGQVKIAYRDSEYYTLQDIVDELESQLNLIFSYYMTGSHPNENEDKEEYERFTKSMNAYWNNYGVPLGSTMYGIFLNSKGSSVFGIGLSPGVSSKAVLRNIEIKELRNSPLESPQIMNNRGPINDVMDLTQITNNGLVDLTTAKYIGNAHSDAQYALNSLVTNWGILSHNSITSAVNEWIRDGTPLSATKGANDIILRCNNDIMLHVAKGIFGLRVDNIDNFDIHNIHIHSLHNLGTLGSEICGNYMGSEDGGHHIQNNAYEIGYTGTEIHAISIIGSYGTIDDVKISDILSARGDAHAFRVLGDNKINIGNVEISDVHAGAHLETNEISAPYLPNKQPRACALSLWKENNEINYIEQKTISSRCLTMHKECSSDFENDYFTKHEDCTDEDLLSSANNIQIGSFFKQISSKDSFHKASYDILLLQTNQPNDNVNQIDTQTKEITNTNTNNAKTRKTKLITKNNEQNKLNNKVIKKKSSTFLNEPETEDIVNVNVNVDVNENEENIVVKDETINKSTKHHINDTNIMSIILIAIGIGIILITFVILLICFYQKICLKTKIFTNQDYLEFSIDTSPSKSFNISILQNNDDDNVNHRYQDCNGGYERIGSSDEKTPLIKN